jgi:hypothetical protein
VLSFVAGAAADVFPSDLAEAIEAVVRPRLADAGTAPEVYRSDPVDAVGWSRLQTRVAKTLPAAPQLTGMDAYQSVYLPSSAGEGGVERVAIPNVADPLEIGSLDALLGELRAFAEKASLPTDDVELMQLAAHYLENDALIDQDLDVQTYVQLMLAAKQSAAHGVPLWIAVE